LNGSDSIVEKVRSLSQAPWGGSADFEAAFDSVLKVCEKHRLPYDDMPSLILFSEMHFNQASAGSGKRHTTMREVMKHKLANTAWKLGWKETETKPVVFWNLRDTRGHPAKKDTEGAVLLSGFSPSLLKVVMHRDALAYTEVEVVQKDGTTRIEKVRITPARANAPQYFGRPAVRSGEGDIKDL
jgi:hypothetical protein